MVKLIGPCLALRASGTLAKTLTFANSRGNPLVRPRAGPTNAPSPPQLSIRAMFGFLTHQWPTLTAAQKATWNDRAEVANVPPMNAYVAFNLSRHHDGNTPTQEYPPAAIQAPSSMLTGYAIAEGPSITLFTRWYGFNEDWGWTIHRSTTPAFPPAWSNCLAAQLFPPGGTKTYTDSPLPPNTYYYRLRAFTYDGNEGNWGSQLSATIP